MYSRGTVVVVQVAVMPTVLIHIAGVYIFTLSSHGNTKETYQDR
jgi:uncharacterized membrane protein